MTAYAPADHVRAGLDTAALEIVGLTKRYRDKTALGGIDLSARGGEITAVLGPNGAGKSTTIECCIGLKPYDAGRIRVLGMDPVSSPTAVRAATGVMLQDGGLPPGARPLELLAHLARMHSHPRDVTGLAEQLGIAGFTRRTIRHLSGGQRQRVALAAALIGRPSVVFLDEPSAGLDPQSRLAVWQLIDGLRADSVAVVLTTHMMAEAERLADRVYVIDDGSVVARGTPEELTKSDGDDGPARITFATESPVDIDALHEHLAARFGAGIVVDTADGDFNNRDDGGTADSALGRHYVVTGSITPDLVSAVAGWCAEQSILLDSLSTGRRSLEDVFLDLTGRTLQ